MAGAVASRVPLRKNPAASAATAERRKGEQMQRSPRRSLAVGAAGLTAAIALIVPALATTDDGGNTVLDRALDYSVETRNGGTVVKSENDVVARLSSAPLEAGMQRREAGRAAVTRARGESAPSVPRVNTVGCQKVFSGRFRNIRVNQDCSLRRQAEEVIAVNPRNADNLIAGQNDSRVGFNHCGYAYSFDGGRTWGDLIPPFYGYVFSNGVVADACSDPTVTFDADGNAYIAGILFEVVGPGSALVVAKSNADFGGSFFHSPDSSDPYQAFTANPGVVADDSDGAVFHDKEFIVADANAGSAKKNNVYVTWTRFTLTNGPIYFSQSEDGGASWSPGVEISGANAAVCVFGGPVCDQDQGSHPIVGPDGTIYVIFGNANTPDFGVNQVLVVKCPVGNDCSSAGSWSDPVKIDDLIGLHPVDFSGNVNGCPTFRQCLPPNGYRVPEFTSMSLSIDKSNTLYAVWSDFRNGGPPCDTLDTQTATPPCDNDVFYAYSTDGGSSWSDAVKVTPAASAQWQPWSDVTSDGKSLFIAYYDRSYGQCEQEGCNDITLAEVRRAATSNPSISRSRLTTASMPNLVPTNNPVQAGFLGDYMWVDVDHKNRVHVVWSDTRGRGGSVPEEDIYYARAR
jgi:hypothetical protein